MKLSNIFNNPIFSSDNWREIAATLSRNRTRTLLTAFGIFWGTAMLALLLGGSNGTEGMLWRNLEGLATNTGAVFPARTTLSYKGFNKGLYWSMTRDDAAAIIASAPGIKLATSVYNGYGSIAYGTNSTNGYITGYDADFADIIAPKLVEGRLLNKVDVSRSSKVALIGKRLADNIFRGESPIGKFVNASGVFFKVIGVIEQQNEFYFSGSFDEALIIPESIFNIIFNRGNNIDYFIFTAEDNHRPKDIEPYIRKVLERNHSISPDDKGAISFLDISEEFSQVDNIFGGLRWLAFIVGFGALLAGIIGVGNIMWIIVRERTQEIGIRRAIGAKPRDIIAQILTEGMVLTVIAGLAGVVFATGVLALVENITADGVHADAGFVLPFGTALAIVLIFLVLGSAAGLIPAIKAMRIKPLEAMRDK